MILLLFPIWASTYGQLVDIGFSHGIIMPLEYCFDFGSLKEYDSVHVVTKGKTRVMGFYYQHRMLTKVIYPDSVYGSLMATRSYRYSDSGFLQQVEQSDGHVYLRRLWNVTNDSVVLKIRFKRFYEHDGLGRLSKLTDLWYHPIGYGYDVDTVTAKVRNFDDGIGIYCSEPYGRKILIAYDDQHRIKTRTEYNRSGNTINEWSYSYEKKRHLIATFKLYRDAIHDTEEIARTFVYVLTMDKTGIPSKIFDGQRTLYFCYY